MATPQLPDMSDLANIRDALNLYYYGQVVPTAEPVAGLAKEFGDISSLVSSLGTTLDNRKPPKILVQASEPASPVTSDTVGGIWIDTDSVSTDPAANLAHYWDSGANEWVPLSGKVLESYPYVWTAPHTFKSSINYFVSSAARDVIFPAPAEGNFALLGNKFQIYNGGWKTVSVPAAGTTKQALLKLSNTDFDAGWADVVTPTGNNTLSGSNTFTGSTVFSVAPSMVGVTVTGTATLNILNVSGAATLASATITGTLTQNGAANLNGKTSVANGTPRDSGLFVGTRRLYVSSTQPTTGVAGDIWIQG